MEEIKQLSKQNERRKFYKAVDKAKREFQPRIIHCPSRRCLHFEVVGGLEWSNDPENYAGSSIATGRASLAGKVKGDDPD